MFYGNYFWAFSTLNHFIFYMHSPFSSVCKPSGTDYIKNYDRIGYLDKLEFN